MPERINTKDSCTVLLVDATEAEVMQLRKDMPGWLWIEAPKSWPNSVETPPAVQSLDAIIVFAHKNNEGTALDVCKRICEKNLMDGVPLLVAASRYQMTLANEVKRLTRGHFIFMPIEEESLLNRINEIKHAKH